MLWQTLPAQCSGREEPLALQASEEAHRVLFPDVNVLSLLTKKEQQLPWWIGPHIKVK